MAVAIQCLHADGELIKEFLFVSVSYFGYLQRKGVICIYCVFCHFKFLNDEMSLFV